MERRHPRRRSALILAPAAAVLLAGTLVGCHSAKRVYTAIPDATKIDWSTFCHGQGVADLRQLLSGGSGAMGTTHWRVSVEKDYLNIDQLCQAETSTGFVNVYVTSDATTTAAQWLASNLFAPDSPKPRPFAAGEGARIWPAHAQAVLTCHQRDGRPIAVLVDVSLKFSAAQNPQREQLMEHLVRTRVAAVRGASYCGKPA